MATISELAVALVDLGTAQFKGYLHIHLHHWNVVGKNFLALHSYFGELYDMVSEDLDIVAERLRAMNYALPASIFNADADYVVGADAMVADILLRFEAMITKLHTVLIMATDLNDQATINMAASLLEKYEKEKWKLMSLQG